MNPVAFTKVVFIAIVLTAAFWDFRRRRIPNFLTFTGMALGIAGNFVMGGYDGLAASLLGLTLGAAIMLVPYALGGMGAGDVKLLACAGSMLGPTQVFYAFIAAAVLGGLMALAAGKRLGPAAGSEAGARPRSIPYGLPLAAGVLLAAVGVWL